MAELSTTMGEGWLLPRRRTFTGRNSGRSRIQVSREFFVETRVRCEDNDRTSGQNEIDAKRFA
jgi:hypothetical protein